MKSNLYLFLFSVLFLFACLEILKRCKRGVLIKDEENLGQNFEATELRGLLLNTL